MKFDLDTDSDIQLGPGLGALPGSQLKGLTSFHGYLATGAFIGVQMAALGKRLLGIKEGERIHVVCETYNCLPDPFQYLEGCTIGNKGLVIKDTGKMAVTITKHTPPDEEAPGVRIVLDVSKTMDYPKLLAEGYRIDSGPIESSCKNVVQAPMKCVGMRWGRSGASAMPAVRCTLLSDLCQKVIQKCA